MGSPFKRLKEVYSRTYSLDTGRDADFFDCVNDIYFSPEVQSLKNIRSTTKWTDSST